MTYKPLAAYEKATAELSAFVTKNKTLLEAYNNLLLKQQQAEEELKYDVKTNLKDTVASDHFRVLYTVAKRRFYSPAIVFEAGPSVVKKLQEAGGLEVVTKVFDDLVEHDKLPRELRDEALVEEELSPRVTIKEL